MANKPKRSSKTAVAVTFSLPGIKTGGVQKAALPILNRFHKEIVAAMQKFTPAQRRSVLNKVSTWATACATKLAPANSAAKPRATRKQKTMTAGASTGAQE